jgi:lantibiotic modifying enzyme
MSVVRISLLGQVKATINFGYRNNNSLVTGNMGRLLFLLKLQNSIKISHLSETVNNWTHKLLEDVNRRRWRCATPLGITTVGLMTGVSGLGYTLLKLANPDSVPLVLAGEEPKPCV